MTTVANIKGYINGAEWGVYEPAPSLLDYEEIIAAATSQNINNLIAELNQYPVEYYNMLLADNHLFEPWYHTWFALWYKDQNNNWLYYDYIDWTYSTYDGKSMGDMDINSIIYNPTTNIRSTFYREW